METKRFLGVLLVVAALTYMVMPAYSAQAPNPYEADPKVKEVPIDMKAYKGISACTRDRR